MFIDYIQEVVTDATFDIASKRWIKPYYMAFTVFRLVNSFYFLIISRKIKATNRFTLTYGHLEMIIVSYNIDHSEWILYFHIKSSEIKHIKRLLI